MRFNLNPFMRNVDKGIFFPTQATPPGSLTTMTVLSQAISNVYKIYICQRDGWYVLGATGGTGSNGYNGAGGQGGLAIQVVYLYAGSKVLLWGGQGQDRGRNTRLTGYPIPTGNGGQGGGQAGQWGNLGGGGATPATYGESGGGGGGAGGHGGYAHKDGGYGGGGAGVIAGLDTVLDHTESFACGNIFSVKTVESMVLAGGGGGGCGDNNTIRSGAPGGGAWGNGGNSNTAGGGGPGGDSFGRGEDRYANYSAGARGAWCIRDFSQNIFSSGLGNASFQDHPFRSGGFSGYGSAFVAWVADQGPYTPEITTKIDLGNVGGG